MASQRARSRNNVKAGALTLVCLVLFVIWIVAVGDLLELFQPKERYVVEFPLDMGTQGIAVGSPVEVGGQPVGRVADIERVLEPGERGVVAVTIAIDSSLEVYENAEVELRRPLLGAGAALNFSYLGDSSVADPGNGDPLLQPAQGERLMGQLAPGFLAQLGFTREDIEATRETLANLQEISDRVADVTAQVEGELPGRFADFEVISEDLRTVVEQMRERWPTWIERVESVLERSENVTATAETIADNVDAGVTEARSLVQSAQDEFDAASPKVQSILDNLDEGVALAREDVVTLLERAREGLDGYVRLGEQLDDFSAEQQPNLERIIANARLASEQLKLTTQEVRRAPWRLLYRPNQRELEEELLYDAARSYAQAVNDLWAATAALREIETRAESASPKTQQRLEQLLADMEQALAHYQQVEDEFLERLGEE
jgi:ABC-type transporter Mla subunit MlaD